MDDLDPSRLQLGLPWPWVFHKITIRGDTCYFWAYSPRTFAVGFEDLQDGFIFFLGVFCLGWGSISAAFARDTDGSPKGQDAERLDGEAATAGAAGIAQEPSP